MFRATSALNRPPAPAPISRRRRVLGIAALCAIALVVLATPPLRRFLGARPTVSAARLGFATVERGPFLRDVAGEGRVVAAVSPTLYAANAGTVTLRVQSGDPVRRGQVLAVLDGPGLKSHLAQERSQVDALRAEVARAEVEARQQNAALRNVFEFARIDLQSARNELARQTQAFEAGATAHVQVDHARDALDKAVLVFDQAAAGRGMKADSLRLDVLARQSALARQELLAQDIARQVAELDIRSPVAGQVGQLFVAERASVAPGSKLLSVIDLSTLEVQMQVAESFARELRPGMAGEITGNGQQWPGRVSSVSPEVVNGEVSARLRFAGTQPAQLRQNQRLSVRVVLDRREDTLTLRRGAFADEAGGAFAYVVRDGGIAQRIPVRLGVRSIDQVEVLEGLKPGDRVVISGAQNFHGAQRAVISD